MKKLIQCLIIVSITHSMSSVSADDAIGPDHALFQGQSITSQNGAYTLWMQADGSLVMYRNANNTVRYSMAKHGNFAKMQLDGNFVEYTSDGTWLWATHTETNNGSLRILLIRDDGDLWVSSQGPYFVPYWSIGSDPSPVNSSGNPLPAAGVYPVIKLSLPGGEPPSSPAIIPPIVY